MTITIRAEEAGDAPAIRALTDAAFRDMPFSNGSEGPIIEQLRADGDLVLSLVAVNADRAVIGHIAFSPVTISDGARNWFSLGPVSVIPLRQKSGIGRKLIEHGIDTMQGRGAKGIVLLGDPVHYNRYGFCTDPRLTYPGPPAAYFQMKALGDDVPTGVVRYAPAFENASAGTA